MVLKNCDGKTRPSKIMFWMTEPWVIIKDLPLYKPLSTFGNALGNWLGDVVKFDIEKDGFMGGTIS